MLVLSRKEGQGLKIGDILVTVTEVRGKRVRLGVAAPPEVKILRTELADEQRCKTAGAVDDARRAVDG